ncbi:dihydrofolate reductase family protein [Arthrobacter sp. ISL-28]|uniref:dihydrofolate reductase family protein n=1 Tax=Arthrobacter sp. ISL-28 TaxID=2819108 RepID=UPI001BEA3872|nr:dihydrofolate reductase family protein [Arthrobacter sp. ISL-28]MBT2522337.1 dihydrofolate reductase family protein [Arthrobacter sp. ISL-28]
MKLTVHTFVTLDNVMQGPGGREEDTSGGFEFGGWLVPYVDDDFGRLVDAWFAEADAILLGRTTYEMFQPYWEQVTDPGDAVAAALNSLPKYVVSNTISNPTWTNTSVLSGNFLEAIDDLKSGPGRELQVHGSHQLARALHDAGLVDEYRVIVFPLVLGQGKRLFDNGAVPSAFTLAGSKTTAAGAVHLTLLPTAFGAGELEVGEFEVREGREQIKE